MPDPIENDAEAAALEAIEALGDDDEDEGGAGQPSDDGGDAGGDPAPRDDAASGEDDPRGGGEVEPRQGAAIEPPDTFTPELKERFKALPPDLQQTLAQWETERNKGVSTKLEEAAKTRTAADQERQRLAQTLETAISLTQAFNPVIAEGIELAKNGNAGWLKLAREDQATYVEKRASFEAEMAKVQGMVAERNRILQQQHADTLRTSHEALLKAMPELTDADPEKAREKQRKFAGEVETTLRSYGFSPEEIQGANDHRMYLVIRDAMRWRAGEAARKAAAGKVVQPKPKVVKPGGGNAGTGKARSEALQKRLRNSSSIHDQAEALAALLD